LPVIALGGSPADIFRLYMAPHGVVTCAVSVTYLRKSWTGNRITGFRSKFYPWPKSTTTSPITRAQP
jgi:hypothetical protein